MNDLSIPRFMQASREEKAEGRGGRGEVERRKRGGVEEEEGEGLRERS